LVFFFFTKVCKKLTFQFKFASVLCFYTDIVHECFIVLSTPACIFGWADFWIFWIFNQRQPAADVKCYSKTKVEKAFFFISWDF
jgi:hypothetical protein